MTEAEKTLKVKNLAYALVEDYVEADRELARLSQLILDLKPGDLRGPALRRDFYEATRRRTRTKEQINILADAAKKTCEDESLNYLDRKRAEYFALEVVRHLKAHYHQLPANDH